MNTDKLLDIHATLCADALDLMARKNNDYAGSDGETPFKNFTLSESMGLCSTETGMMVRLSDKFQRLAHALSGQEMLVADEAIRDTVLDIVNYTVLIYAYTVQKADGASANDPL